MHAVVNNQRYRLRFLHYPVKPGQKGKKGRKGTTTCFVDVYQKRGVPGTDLFTEGWVPITSGMAVCGRSERGFAKEQGRQFSLIRALRQDFPERTKALQGALIRAYINSGDPLLRTPCYDLFTRGYRSLYEAVFSERWPSKVNTGQTLEYGSYGLGKTMHMSYPYEGETDAA